VTLGARLDLTFDAASLLRQAPVVEGVQVRQSSRDVFQLRARRRAVTAVMPRSPRTISLRRPTPRALASTLPLMSRGTRQPYSPIRICHMFSKGPTRPKSCEKLLEESITAQGLTLWDFAERLD